MGVELEPREIGVNAQEAAIEGRQNLQSVWGSRCRPQEGRPRNGPPEGQASGALPHQLQAPLAASSSGEEAVPYVNSSSTSCVLYSLPFEALTREKVPGFWGE